MFHILQHVGVSCVDHMHSVHRDVAAASGKQTSQRITAVTRRGTKNKTRAVTYTHTRPLLLKCGSFFLTGWM